jgi:hypothetical protein
MQLFATKAKDIGLEAYLEQQFDSIRPDCEITTPERSIPNCATHSKAAYALTSLGSAETRAKSKAAHYHDFMNKRPEGDIFLPLIMESYGGIHPDCFKLIKEFAIHAANNGFPFNSFSFVTDLSVCLQAYNARIILQGATRSRSARGVPDSDAPSLPLPLPLPEVGDIPPPSMLVSVEYLPHPSSPSRNVLAAIAADGDSDDDDQDSDIDESQLDATD